MTTQYVAFLRGMNLGRRRVQNEELCSCFEALGFKNVAAFLASGNVIFQVPAATDSEIASRVEVGLHASLGYEVPTYLRTADELIAIADVANRTFTADLASTAGKLQVAFLSRAPSPTASAAVVALQSQDDRLAIHGQELFWLPSGGISQSELDMKLVDSYIGPMTIRTERTVERIVAKYFNAREI